MPITVSCQCGKQFQAPEENVGRRFNCSDCGRELTVPKAQTDAYNAPMFMGSSVPKTSGKAITSLVLGILSFFCSLLTGIPAIIFGALGLSDISKSQGRVQGKGLAITGIVLGSLGSVVMILGLLVGLLLPAVQAARESARRLQCSSNLRQIGLGILQYSNSTNLFPQAAIRDADGKPLLSWRVAILPYLDEANLYNQFKLDEPWDSPHNKALIPLMPRIFACPSDGSVGQSSTRYQVIVGRGCLFEDNMSISPSSVKDGSSQTILAVEAKDAVIWTKPDDIDVANLGTSVGSKHRLGYNVLFADGALRFCKDSMNPTVLKSLASRNGGEVISPDAYED